MKHFILRQLERLSILLLGITTAYIAIVKIFPGIEARVPLFLAIFVWYMVTVYILIPLSFRLYRLIRRPDHIPHATSTPDGFQCDPINIALIGTQKQVMKAMKKAGWHTADKRTPRSLARLFISIALNKEYVNAPFSTLFLFGRAQDLGFQIPLKESPKKRHHIRFWAVRTDVPANFKNHVSFWRRKHYFQAHNNDVFMWIGAATKDIGIGFIRHNGQMTHSIDPDTNKERDFVVRSLSKAKMLQSTMTIRANEAYEVNNRVLGCKMIVDGNITVCTVKQSL